MTSEFDRSLLTRVRRLSMRTRRRGGGDLLGFYRSRLKGHGLEYSESRDYEPGDDIRRMDWKVMARTRSPHTKIFEEERQLRVAIFVDTSDSMRFGATVRTKLQTALHCAAILAYAAIRERDVADVVLFNDHVEGHFGPIARDAAFWSLVGELERVQLSPYDGPRRIADLEVVAENLRERRRLPQVAIVLSDFDGTGDPLVALAGFRRRLDVIPIRIQSVLELAGGIANGVQAWNPESGAVGTGRAASDGNFDHAGPHAPEIDDVEDLVVGLTRAFRSGVAT